MVRPGAIGAQSICRRASTSSHQRGVPLEVSRIRIAFLLLLSSSAGLAQPQPPAFRPPAVPLITHDPYFSVWSMTAALTDGPPRHWTGTAQSLSGLVRID